jgi:CDP-diacylglycerol---glycerol-3-phosphate 3-phosphatidyltransferase
MVAVALILLCTQYPSIYYVLPVTLIMSREIGISALREWMAERGLRNIVQVGKLGKIKTTLQMISLSILLLVFPGQSTDLDLCHLFHLPKPNVFFIGLSTLYISMIATMISGGQYFLAALPELLTKKEKNHQIKNEINRENIN